MSPWICPEVLLVLAGVGLILMDALLSSGKRSLLPGIALVTSCVLLAGTIWQSGQPMPSSWGNLFVTDGLSSVFKPFFVLCLVGVTLISVRTPMGREEAFRSEFLALPFFSTAGLCLLASAHDFLAIFVALELVAISLYLLVAFQRTQVRSLEAGMKLLVMGGLSTGFLVMGIAWLYAAAGTTEFTRILLEQAGRPASLALLLAVGLIVTGLAFKIAAVPFHAWAPDVYEGAPTSITAFLAVASKAAGFVLLVRIFGFGAFALDSVALVFRPVLLTLDCWRIQELPMRALCFLRWGLLGRLGWELWWAIFGRIFLRAFLFSSPSKRLREFMEMQMFVIWMDWRKKTLVRP